jgi:hypothetical protein
MTEMVKEDDCVDDNSISDLYGQTCASLYDSSPEYCGQLDSAQFSAATLCCACGGGAMTVGKGFNGLLSADTAATSMTLQEGCYDRDSNPIDS